MLEKILNIDCRSPLVSIIINCFNGREYLAESLRSVLDQTYTSWEVIFWDNQSTDKSREILEGFHEPRFKYYLASEHTPLGEARRLAIDCATGEWLAFLDCDDIWFPDKLEKQILVIEKNDKNLGLIYCQANPLVEAEGLKTSWGSAALKHARSGKINVLPSGNIFPAMLMGNYVPLVSAMVNRAAYYDVGGINMGLKQAEDYELFVKIAKNYYCAAINEVLCLFRIHSNNWTHQQSEKSYTEAILVVSNFLPAAEAKKALAIWRANYAGFLFKNGRSVDALLELIKSGNYLFFFRKVAQKLFRN